MAVSRCSVQTGLAVLADAPQNTDYTLKESVFHGTSQFPLAIYDDNIGLEEVAWHWHEEFEAGWITEGAVLIGSGSRKYLLKQGDGFFINSGMLHAVKNGSPNCPAALRSIVFHRCIVGGVPGSVYDTDYVLPILSNHEFPEYIFRQDSPRDTAMLALISSAWQSVFSEEADYALSARNALSHLFARLIPLCADKRTPPSADLVRERRAQTMLAFLHNHFSENITLREVAGQASVSASEALRCFQQVVGLSPMQYLKKYRLSKAAQFLREGVQSVSDICSLCGFEDHSYFTKSFRKLFGCSPSEYRSASVRSEKETLK